MHLKMLLGKKGSLAILKFNTADVGTNICYNIVRLLDDSVPYDDFVNAFSSYDLDPVHNVRLDFDNITIASGSGNEIMIDCTKID